LFFGVMASFDSRGDAMTTERFVFGAVCLIITLFGAHQTWLGYLHRHDQQWFERNRYRGDGE
jgi:hypothetical protein